MTLPEAIRILEVHNLTRHGKMIAKPNPKQLTEAIEIAIHLLTEINKQK